MIMRLAPLLAAVALVLPPLLMQLTPAVKTLVVYA